MKQFFFDGFRLDAANRLLLRNDSPVALAPKAFDTLLYLLENRGRLVTREELMQAIWPDSFVEGANLTVYISLLRKALGEENGRRYIETVPRKGYRMTAEVRETVDAGAPEPAEPVAKPAPPRFRIPAWTAAGGTVLLAGALWLATIGLPRAAQIQRTRLTSFGPELAVTAAAISPDGRLAAYGNAGGIFVQQIEGGETHRLAMPAAPFTALSMSWYPDGGKLLVGGFAGDDAVPGLWALPVMGDGAPVRIGEGLNAAVSPEGSLIAMSGSVCWDPPELQKTEAPAIRLIRPDGEGLRTLVTGKAGETFGPVEWMDGGRLVWVRYRWNAQLRRNTGSIESYDLGSGKQSDVLAGTDFSGDVASVKGRLVYALMLGANPSSKYGGKLFGLYPDSRTAAIAELSEPVAGLSAGAGGRLLVRNAVVEHSVFVADLDRAAPALENIRRLTLGLGREDFPRAWTADSQAIVFDSNRNGTWELFRQKLDAATDQAVVHSGRDSFSPRLSPDGQYLLYFDRERDWAEPRPVSVVRTPVSGGPAQLVLKAAGISAWGLRFECAAVRGGPCVLAQQQGDSITFRRFDPAEGFVAGGGEVARIDRDPAHPVAWSLAPDGSKLAWARWQAAGARIHVTPLASGAGAWDVEVRDCSRVHAMRWSADGKGWFLTSELPVSWSVSYAGSDGAARVLARMSGMHAPSIFPAPDGRHVAFSQQIVESNLWLLQNY